MDALLAFLLSNANLFFLVAIAAMFAGLTLGRKSARAARAIAIVSLCASAPLLVLYGIASVYRPDIMTLALTALWGWNVWSSWSHVRRTRPSKPSRPPPAARRN